VTDTLICPHCREKLWVGNMQIPLVTCPRCLGVIVNPNAATGLSEPPPIPRRSAEPRDVIPIEDEVKLDLRATILGLVVLGLTLLMGGLGAIFIVQMPALSVILIGAAMMVAGGVLFAKWQAAAGPLMSSTGPSRGGGVLEYQRSVAKLPYIQQPKEHVSLFAFFGGFIMAIVIGIICFYSLVATGERSSVATRRLVFAGMVVVIVGLIVAAVNLRRSPGWRGFGRGVAIGLALALMALGPCAACYVMTLFG
jgi:hypothetical protein